MAIIRPPITGNPALDSYLDRVARDLSRASIDSLEALNNTRTTTTVGGQNIYSATVVLWTRTSENEVPDLPSQDVDFNFDTGLLIVSGSDTDTVDGWHLNEAPSVLTGAYLWRTYVHISGREEAQTIDSETWATPTLFTSSIEGLAVPNTPTNVVFSRTSRRSAELSWTVDDSDLNSPGSYVVIERSEDSETWVVENTVATTTNKVSITGTENGTTYFRLRVYNLIGVHSSYTDNLEVAPIAPLAPTEFNVERQSADVAYFTWSVNENDTVRTRYYVLEHRHPGEEFQVYATIGEDQRGFAVTSLATENMSSTWRLLAVSEAGLNSPYSAEQVINVPSIGAPTNFRGTPIEDVGVLTTVNLTWSLPAADFFAYSSITIQFRPVTTPVSEWFDVATVDATENETDILPPQQGTIEFRIRSVATNEQVSAWTESGQIFISGGSATDDAIYGGDGAYISQNHYSINDDDFYLDTEAASLIVSEGDLTNGTYDAEAMTISGDTDSEMIIEWTIQVTQNMVDRNRHFYLTLGNISEGGNAPIRYWGLNKRTVYFEVLSDPANTAFMYSKVPTVEEVADNDYIFTDSDNRDATNTRTYTSREAGDFMYSTRNFIRLPIRETFTFRDNGQAKIRMRFTALAGAYPILDVSNGNTPKLEAFATEKLDTTVLSNVTNTGTEWTFSEDFEGTPCIFITPGGNTTTYWTEKSSTSVRIHTTSTDGIDCDVTARGY